LKLMIRNLAENIAKRWKFQMFARIVLKTLHRSNRHDVRMSAFECLLMLMDIFGDDPDDNVQGFTLPAFAKGLEKTFSVVFFVNIKKFSVGSFSVYWSRRSSCQ
jgi:hypothetical protein